MVEKSKIQFAAKNGVTGRQSLLKTFTIDITSITDDTRYKGKFTTKKLSVSDLAAIGVRKIQLNGGFHFDPEKPGHGIEESTDNLNSWIAHLEVALVETPEWWDLEKITDMDVLSAVYQEVILFENSFLARKRDAERARHMGTGEDGGEEDQEESRSDRVSSSLVESEIQSALEP